MNLAHSLQRNLSPKMLFNYSGRASRAEYWWFFLGSFILNVVMQFALSLFLLSVAPSDSASTVLFISTVGLIIYFALASTSVTARRFHDHGKSAWWLLISLIPLVGFIVVLVFLLKPSSGPNQYGEFPYKAPPRALGNLA